MTDPLLHVDPAELDFSHSAMEPAHADAADEADPWLARRRLTWGASEAAALMCALGRRHPEDFPTWVQREARVTRGPGGIKAPRCLMQKAGLVRPLKRGKPAALGLERERLLAEQFRRGVEHGAWSTGLDATTIAHADAVPREWMPLVDRHAPELSCTPDCWARDVLGDLVAIDMKCSVHPYLDKYQGAPPQYVLQLHVQMDVMACESALVVEGEGWGAKWKDHGGSPSGPIRVWPVERDEALVEELRDAAREGMRRVEALREEAI